MTEKPDKPQEKPGKPQEQSEPTRRPVPPRQNDPLLDDYDTRAEPYIRETKQK